MIYRGMDRQALDAAYNNQSVVPAYAAIKASWAERSAALRQQQPGHLDLRYGAAPRQRLDLFLAAEPKAPTLAYIHGGYWQANDKETYSFVAAGPREHGINVAILEHTLAPEARMDRIVAEIREAVAWLAANLDRYGADPGRLYLGGHSAGGHLTAMLIEDKALRGGLAISGLFDLEPIRLNYLNAKLGLDPEEAARNSPQHNLPSRPAPLIIAYGTGELPELCRQSLDYHAAWQRHDLPARLVPVAGANHFSVVEELANPHGLLTEALRELTAAD